MSSEQEKILAASLFQMRVLLSDWLGPQSEAPMHLRVAAHLAYALHNEALAVFEGKTFNAQAALAKIAAIDNLLGTEDGAKLVRQITGGQA
jgi:hypothetical protein